MNEIIKQRIEEAANTTVQNLYDYARQTRKPKVSAYSEGYLDAIDIQGEFLFKEGANYALSNQWISVEEALPEENRIIARLSESFCGTKDCIEVLHFCERYGLTSPEGYYDLCGENVPTNAITHWMPIPSLEGGEK